MAVDVGVGVEVVTGSGVIGVGVGVGVGVRDGVDHSISSSSKTMDLLTVPERVVVDVLAGIEVVNADDVELEEADVTVLVDVAVG